MKIALPLMLALLAHGIGQQPDSIKPYSAKQDALGETLAEYKANNSTPIPNPHPSKQFPSLTPDLKDCTVDENLGLTTSKIGVQECITPNTNAAMTYANIITEYKIVKFFHDQLFYVGYGIHHNGFDALKSALIGKYGPPTDEGTVKLQNKIGAEFVGHNSTWKNGVSTIVLAEYGADLETSSVNFFLDKTLLEVDSLMKSDTSKNAKRDM